MNKKYPYDFIKAVNDKYIKDLSIEYKEIIVSLFESFDEYEKIKVEKIYKSKKSLISIKIGNKKEYLNILFKKYHVIAETSIIQFTNFLKSNKVNSKIIEDLLFLLWGDLTYNNTGKVRYDSNTLYTNFSDKLCKVNKELNKKEIIKSIISKYLFSDDIITKKINYILYYNNKWKVISFDKLINLLTNTNFNYEKIIYSGPLIIQSKARNLNFKKEYESYRNYISIRWYYYNRYLL